MNFSMNTDFLIGLGLFPALIIVATVIFKQLSVTSPERHETLHLRFGRLVEKFTKPGLLGVFSRSMPFDQWITLSQQWDQRIYHGIETNDGQGTSVQVDLRVTFRIKDGERALFAVHDWDEALESVTAHEAAARLAGRDRAVFLACDPSLSTTLTESVRETMADYGIDIGEVRIMNVQFRAEVARQMFEAVAAKLEVAKAVYEEKGRNDSALLLAQTEHRVAEFEAKAKTESLQAVGRAYQVMQKEPEIYQAYTDLYKLSQMDPGRVVSFEGFKGGDLSSAALVEADLEFDENPPRERSMMRNKHLAGL